jgi:7-carboxy-7-deazaguanine synthase
MIRISEIFGPVIQGEGIHIGEPTIFVRVGGCDYRCSWCDTMYAVDPIHRADWHPMSDADICAAVQELSSKPILITLSGGNPALYDFANVIAHMQASGYHFTIETQGSIAANWFRLLDSMTLSPKPPSSNMPTDYQKLERCMDFLEPDRINLKIVVADQEDYEYARQTAARFPHLRCFLQVCNPNPTSDTSHPFDLERERDLLLAKLQWLTELVLADSWFKATVLPQLHVLIYGNRRGV